MREVGLGRLRKLFALMWLCGFITTAGLNAMAFIQFNFIWTLLGFGLGNLFFIAGLICFVEYRYGMGLQVTENHLSTIRIEMAKSEKQKTGKGKGKN